MSVRVVIGDWAAMRGHAEPIRIEVFVNEQQVPLDLEWDEFDAVSLHAIAWVGEVAIGTARLLPDGHIGRLAVLKSWRSLGAGRALMMAMMDEARHAGHRRVVIHAQCHAENFYRRLGFSPEGDTFMEAGIPHVAMVWMS